MMEKFNYEVPGSSPKKKIQVNRFSQVPFGVMRKARNADESEAVFMLIEGMADEKNLEVIDSLMPDEVAAFIEAWQADSGATAGE